MSEKNSPAPPEESRQIPPHSDGKVSNPAPPEERCFECHHSYASHEWKEGRCRNGNCDCPEYERGPAMFRTTPSHRELAAYAPAPLADGGEILTRPEFRDYVNRLDDKTFVDDLLLHDAALRERAEKAEAEVERLRAEQGILISQRDEARGEHKGYLACLACQREREKLAAAVGSLYFAANWHADRDVDATALWAAVRDAAGIKPGQTAERVGPDRGCARAEKLAAALREIARGDAVHRSAANEAHVCAECHRIIGIAARALADGEKP